MTQEEKQLLLKDLCARLPYGVKIQRDNVYDANTKVVETLEFALMADNVKYDTIEGLHVKPYLRSMSSMTEEEKNEFCNLANCDKFELEDFVKYPIFDLNISYTVYDWLNEHHFDYRRLIEKELALEAPEGMYKVNN